MAKKNLSQAALGLSHRDTGRIFVDGDKPTPEENAFLRDLQDMKKVAKLENMRQSDKELQESINTYNNSLPSNNEYYEGITIPSNQLIVKVARLPHLNSETGFVIPRTIWEPSRSGADIQGHSVTDNHPYFPFGYVVNSNSDWVPQGHYVQLHPDAVRQQYQREEGKFMYVLENGIKPWYKEEHDLESLDRYIMIRDFHVQLVFNEDYEPKF